MTAALYKASGMVVGDIRLSAVLVFWFRPLPLLLTIAI
jgi:hypothetical protein